MRRFLKIVAFLVLSNIALFGGTLGELTTKLDKCQDFASDVEKTKSPIEYNLFGELKEAETKDKEGNKYISFKSSSINQIVRLYIFEDEKKAYNALKNSLTDNSTPVAKYDDIKDQKSSEQTLSLLQSLEGFNCYIKKGNETWIALYPYGKKDKEDKKDKKTVAIIQNNSDGTKMFFYQKPPKND